MTLTEGWIYGIDVNSSCVGIGLINVETQEWRTQGCAWRPPGPNGGVGKTPPLPHSLDACCNSVFKFLWRLKQDFPAAACAIEQPMGAFRPASLHAHWAAVNIGAYRALEVTPFNYKGAPDWRKRLGLVNRKQDALAWAVGFGFDLEAHGEDQAEGLGIAAAALRDLTERWPLALTPWVPVGT